MAENAKNEKIYIIVPSFSLRDNWIERLRVRFCETNSDKDYRAFCRIASFFTQDIKEILDNSKIPVYTINSIEYELGDISK